jgi:hypothetical protein
VTSVFVWTVSVVGAKPVSLTTIVEKCAGGVGLVLPPQAARASATNGNTRRTRME